jgi:two-component system, chemotaxis family, CheB/CheR fusion protein
LKKLTEPKKSKPITVNSTTESGHHAFLEAFPIVGLGASAGGLDALEQFFTSIPDDKRTTQMKVFAVTDGLPVKPNCLYVIPSNTSMSILKGILYLFEPTEIRGMRLPIDFFFHSLAADQKEHSIGIILSGMGSDGSKGVQTIKENAGLVLVQEPSSAKFDGMPRSAIDSVNVDIVAPANQLAIKLMAYLKHNLNLQPSTAVPFKDQGALDKITILLRSQTGHDFSMYKKNTIYRRIERRMKVHQIDKINTYIRFLQEYPNEIDILFKELLIGVSNFFRDPLAWEYIKDNIFPEMFAKLPDRHIIRAWVPACSAGEEAYSLAIIFKEALDNLKPHKNLSLQIFATDLDNLAINKARKGYINANISTYVSPARLSRYFAEIENGYRVNAEIREMIVFAPQNVIKDPPFTKLDFLSCRNLLIYFEPALQKKLLLLFHYSINPGGIMMLGSAETHSSQANLFETIDSRLKLYRRSTSQVNSQFIDFTTSFSHTTMGIKENASPVQNIDNLQMLANQVILQQYAPASVLVNEKGDILYITGRTGKYLEPAAGKATMNILSMARDGLRNELPIVFRKALLTTEPVMMNNLKVGTNGGSQYVNIMLQQLEKPEALKGMVIVIFNDIPKVEEGKVSKRKKENAPDSLQQTALESELIRMKAELQGTLEEMQTSQEELKSANEELQSTNEELTTSKEEMQSLNEELQTVNVELQSKVDDLGHANNDIKNLLNSTEIATLFLDRELNIRRYTPNATKIFNLIASDVGRPITDLVSQLIYHEMATDAQEVIRTLVFIEKPIATNDGRWFSVRVMPYRTLEDRIDGLVITFTNITSAKKLEAELQETISILRAHNLYKP